MDLVDRFYSRRDSERQAGVYRELAERHPRLAARLDGANLEDERTFRGIVRLYGDQASAEQHFADREDEYDLIVSRAVLEHVEDPELSIERMARALRPGGVMLHKIDLRDHGLFSHRHHELTFLGVPRWLWRRMSHGTGRPNRALVHRYRAALECTTLRYEILVTRLAGVGDVTPHLPFQSIATHLRERSIGYVQGGRGWFASEFRSVADADLAVARVFIVATKLV